MQGELSENLPDFMKGEEKNLYSIVVFEKLSEFHTKPTLYGIGYKNAGRQPYKIIPYA